MDLITTSGMRILAPAALSGISQLRDYDGDVFAEITSQFCEQCATQLSSARRAIGAGDIDGLIGTAREVASSATLLGAERMALCASALQTAAEGGRQDELTRLLSGLVQAYYATCASLRFVSGGRRES
jgi:HPt (histidine-containing phosphotransfer) domain-containing protein